MRVKIYDTDKEGGEYLRCACDLSDVFDPSDGDGEYQITLSELKRSGRVWVGGGAAPLVLLMSDNG
jgi:hypothetical protein